MMRRAAVTVSIKGHDVTLDLMPYLVSLTYTDKADEELDDRSCRRTARASGKATGS
ncbi:MAG: hypothetical protein ACLUPV_10345 [Bilophila wadsworthia]